MTDIGRVSTYAVFQSTLKDSSNVEAELATMQEQLSSGLKSQNFAGISDQSQQFIDLDNKLSKSSQYVTNNTLAATQLDATNTALTQVINAAQTLQSLISTRQTGALSDSGAYQLQIQQQWSLIASALNSNSNGQFLFSGTATNTPTVDPTKFPSIGTDGATAAPYYQGSTQDISLRADDNTVMTTSVRGDSAAFQSIMAGLAIAKTADSSNNTAQFQQAYDLISKGINGVIASQSVVNANKVSITNINTTQNTLQTYWKGTKDDISQADLVSISSKVAVDQGILQASFQAFAKINSLSLADFLK